MAGEKAFDLIILVVVGFVGLIGGIGLLESSPTGNLVFEKGQFSLTVQTTGRGYVSSSPSGIECGYACSEVYSPGTSITLTAKSLGDAFSGWGGACSGTQPTCTLTLDADKTVTASFGDGQSISAPPSPQPLPTPPVPRPPVSSRVETELCCVDKRYNAEYYISETGKCDEGFEDRTSEARNGCSDLAARLRKPVLTPTPVPAPIMPETTYNLIVESPPSVRIRSSDGKINCPNRCSAAYSKDAEVVLQTTLRMNENKQFKVSINQEVTQPKPLPPLPPKQEPPNPPAQNVYVNINPTTGKVTSPDGKVNCPPTCKVTYPQNSIVNLEATPKVSGTKFEGWGGDLTGTSCFPSKNNKCALMLNINRFVIAAFSEPDEKNDNVEMPPSYYMTAKQTAPVTGTWRPYSEAIFYDRGGNQIIKPVTRVLELKQDKTWNFGSTGTWEVKSITPEDWNQWKIQPYGPTSKIVLNGWNNGIGTGPIEESSGNVNFIWVIYRTTTPTLGPATIQIKFGKT